jgi:hypothetical protein
MRRRGFLGLCGAALLAPFVATPVDALPPPAEWTIRRIKSGRFDIQPGSSIGGCSYRARHGFPRYERRRV